MAKEIIKLKHILIVIKDLLSIAILMKLITIGEVILIAIESTILSITQLQISQLVGAICKWESIPLIALTRH